MTDDLRASAFRFLTHVQTGPDCWEWTGAGNTAGYGVFRGSLGISAHAHRAAYRLFVGDIPAGLLVCHHCDNRRCVRPDHLFLGTALDNMRDAQAKGRMARGERNGWATQPARMPRGRSRRRLTNRQVGEVRAMLGEGLPGSEIARTFGVDTSTVSRIKTGSRRRAA